jgi:hypothetical protein
VTDRTARTVKTLAVLYSTEVGSALKPVSLSTTVWVLVDPTHSHLVRAALVRLLRRRANRPNGSWSLSLGALSLSRWVALTGGTLSLEVGLSLPLTWRRSPPRHAPARRVPCRPCRHQPPCHHHPACGNHHHRRCWCCRATTCRCCRETSRRPAAGRGARRRCRTTKPPASAPARLAAAASLPGWIAARPLVSACSVQTGQQQNPCTK